MHEAEARASLYTCAGRLILRSSKMRHVQKISCVAPIYYMYEQLSLESLDHSRLVHLQWFAKDHFYVCALDDIRNKCDYELQKIMM